LPFNLVPFYPISDLEAFSVANVASLLIVAMISWACFYYRKSKPYLAVSWLYYVMTLGPVLGILQIGSQAAADRYTYIPSVSLLLLFSASFLAFFPRHRLVLT